MRTITKRFIDTPIGEVELEYCPCEWVDPIIEAAPNGNVIVGYLCQDSDCQNPLEDCDGMGEIHHHPRSRYGSRDSGYCDALGLDSYGEPRLDLILDRHYDEAFKRYVEKLIDTRGVEWLAETFSEDYTRDEDETDEQFVMDALHQSTEGYPWEQVTFADDMQDVLTTMFHEPEYFPGDPDAILLDLYEHGGVAYSVSGGGMQCRWDTSTGESVWIPDACLRDELEKIADPTGRYRKAKEYAAQACETYTSWCNGDNYGVVVQTHDSEGHLYDEDACWGYIGGDYAEEELAGQVAWRVKHNDKEAA